MNNKRNIFITLIITTFLAVLLPMCFRNKEDSFNDILYIIATLINSTTSLLTLFIAITLLNKFGIETTLLNKNTEVVFSFLEEFKKTIFLIQGKDFMVFINMEELNNKYLEIYYSKKLLFSHDYHDRIDKLIRISENPFMPKCIYKKVNKLVIRILAFDVEEKDIEKYVKVRVKGPPLIENKYGRFNQQDMTLYEFLNIIDEIKTEVNNWIKQNSDYYPDLNI